MNKKVDNKEKSKEVLKENNITKKDKDVSNTINDKGKIDREDENNKNNDYINLNLKEDFDSQNLIIKTKMK